MKTKIFTKIIAPLLMAVTQASANTPNNFTLNVNKDLSMVETVYTTVSTAQLQEEIERRSENGDLSFAMGIELIKRWSNSYVVYR